MYMYTATHHYFLSTTSKDEFVFAEQIPVYIDVCSNSFIMLLDFAYREIKKLAIRDIYTLAFKDCFACGSSGASAVKSLCEFLVMCKNIEHIEFSDCCLKGNARSILSSLSKSLTVSSIRIVNNHSEICDRELVEMLEHLPRKCTFKLSSIKFKANEHNLKVSMVNYAILPSSPTSSVYSHNDIVS